MSKINEALVEALVMMAEQKETFEVNGKKFQVIEVKDAEQPKEKPHPNALTFEELEDGKSYLLAKKDGYMNPSGKRFVSMGFYYLSNDDFIDFVDETTDGDCFSHRIGSDEFRNEYFTKYVHKAEQQPDYSHLVGKWCKFISEITRRFSPNKWYKCEKLDRDGAPFFIDNNNELAAYTVGMTPYAFDLSNPSDTNPDEKKRILVPSEVKILNWSSLLGIGFGEGQFLYLLRGSRSYSVAPIEVTINPIQCELVKCERSELKKGDVAFRTGHGNPNLNNLNNYCVIIDDTKYCSIVSNSDIAVNSFSWNHWYKVTPIEP